MFECFYLRWMRKSNTGSSRNTCMEDRRGLVIPTTGMEHFGSPFLLFPLQRNVQNGGGPYDTASRVGRCNPLLIYLPDFHQRMRDITRTQLCTKEVKIVDIEPSTSFRPKFQLISSKNLKSSSRVLLISIASAQVAEFSECSKTHGFSFVLHCRQLKDDMVCLASLTYQYVYA